MHEKPLLRTDIAIVGTGHGGSQAAIALRQNGFSGSITLIGKECFLPYERPPLSKEYLAREKSFERIMIRPEKFWADKGISLRLSAEVVKVDAGARLISLNCGGQIEYRELIWSAGGVPRMIQCPGAELGNVYAVRNRPDVDAIMSQLDGGAKRVVVIGGGYIGLETAAVLRKLECEVTLLESLPRVLSRVAGEHLSRFFEEEHRARGVDVRVNVDVVAIEGGGLAAVGVKLATGELIPCDMVIVGIGIAPTVEPLADAGAKIGNGIEVDQFCRTSLPHIYAIGDCASHPNAFAQGATIRLESVQNAHDQAIVAARDICGVPEPYEATPWFWSNQYDLRLQTVGLSIEHDNAVLRGDTASRSFSVVYLKEGRVIALDCVNAVKDFVQGRKLVEMRAEIEADLIAKATVALKDIWPIRKMAIFPQL